jgi:hypothetical protein
VRVRGLQADALRPTLLQVHSDPLKFETIPLVEMVTVQTFPLRNRLVDRIASRARSRWRSACRVFTAY